MLTEFKWCLSAEGSKARDRVRRGALTRLQAFAFFSQEMHVLFCVSVLRYLSPVIDWATINYSTSGML